jgi:2-amino-4-hydroxy-6-hydroxymethyldihydropteridine diphosphokinase
MMPRVVGYVGVGSNLGARRAHLRAGVEGIVRAGIPVTALSSVWETEPVDGAGPGLFLNLVARVETDRTPEEVLAVLLAVECERGRVRSGSMAPRKLDLDLLLLGELRRDGPDLVLPHPRMWSRRFVLAPLCELAPDLVRQASGRTVARELSDLDDPHGVRRVGPLYTSESPPVYSRAL